MYRSKNEIPKSFFQQHEKRVRDELRKKVKVSYEEHDLDDDFMESMSYSDDKEVAAYRVAWEKFDIRSQKLITHLVLSVDFEHYTKNMDYDVEGIAPRPKTIETHVK